MIVPRPVRGEPRSILDFNEQQILEFERCIIDNYNKYNNILPPLPYFERLINIMKTGKKVINVIFLILYKVLMAMVNLKCVLSGFNIK